MKIVISALLLVLVAATAGAQSITLNGSVAVNGNYVRLGDLFDNTGDKSNIVVAYAPAPGKQAVFDASWLYRVAQKNRLSWRPLTPRDRAVVRRDSYVVTRQEIEDKILELLRAQGENGDMRVFISNRSLRTVYSTWSINARNSCSGGIEGRPVFAYIRANRRDNDRNASSVSARTARNGWSAGTRCSGDK